LGLSFIVTDEGAIRNFAVTDYVTGSGCGDGSLHEVKGAGLYGIKNGKFAFDVAVRIPDTCGPDGACSGASVQGTFDGTEAASGTVQTSFLNMVTACVGTSSASIQWKAAKDCSLRPQEGLSHDRFCGGGITIDEGFGTEQPVPCGPSHSGSVYSIAVSAAGDLLASASLDKTIKLWSLPTRAYLRTLTGHTSSVNSVAITPDGKVLVSGGDNTVRLWSLPGGEPLGTLSGHTGTVNQVAVSPDGSVAASASSDKTVKLWSLPGGAPLTSLAGHTSSVMSVAFGPDGTVLFSGGIDNTIRVWSLPDGAPLDPMTGHASGVYALMVSPDGKLLASGDNAGVFKLWNLPARTALTSIAAHTGSIAGVRSLAFSPDGATLASASIDNTVKLWSLPDGASKGMLRTDGSAYAVVFSPDGKQLVTGELGKNVNFWSVPDLSKLGCASEP